MSGAQVDVRHVRKSFEDGRIRALEDVSLEVAPGELVALTGPSGCGKSTLLNLIGALDRATAGSITVAGERVEHLPDPALYRGTVVGFDITSLTRYSRNSYTRSTPQPTPSR